jgi:WD40 repeat protein
MMSSLSRKISILLCCLTIHNTAQCSLNFSNRWSSITLNSTSSKIKLNSAVTGWVDSSIIRKISTPGVESNKSLLDYAGADSIITYIEAPGSLIYNNSNAINASTNLCRTNSNAVNVTAILSRTNSNAIVKIVQQQDFAIYKTYQNLTPGQIISGLTRFNAGFSVPTYGGVIFDTCLSSSGNIDLQTTGSLTLQGNLRLDGNCIIHNGGTLLGHNVGLILDGNLTLTAGKVLHISGNTFIDGNNHTLILDDYAQIFVDSNATLTLRNLSFHSGKHALLQPPIKLATASSKLAFDNVTLFPTCDFLFPEGQLFIHNDVKYTGSTAFVYQSKNQSWIAQKSRLLFDHGTTLSVAPLTFRDVPYSNNQTVTSNKFIRMADKSSMLCFNGASLVTTRTGLRLTTGTISFDNASLIYTNDLTTSFNKLNPLIDLNYQYITDPSYGEMSAYWSPNGKFLAVSGLDGLKIYDSTEGAFNIFPNLPNTGISYCGSWSPDGQYIAVMPSTGTSVHIYHFDGKKFTLAASPYYYSLVYTLAWSPDGRFLAIGGEDTGTYARIYRFENGTCSYFAGLDYGSIVHSIAWSPDGKFLAVTGEWVYPYPYFILYEFDGSSFNHRKEIIAPPAYPCQGYSVSWSPDGRYLLTGGTKLVGYDLEEKYQYAQIYSFDGHTLTYSTSPAYNAKIKSTTWAPDGQYIAIAGEYADVDNKRYVQIYGFNDKKKYPWQLVSNPHYETNANSVSWSPDGKYLAACGRVNPYHPAIVYPCDFIHTRTTQAFSSSLVLGDSANGPDYDISLQLANASRINLDGMLNIDNVLSQTIFTHRTTDIVLTTTYSKIRINPSHFAGWKDGSIVRKINNVGMGDYDLMSNTSYDHIISYTDAPLMENPWTFDAQQTLEGGETISGLIHFKNGFSIPAGKSVIFDTKLPVAGGIDLNGTGQIQLYGNLQLEGNSILQSGGRISGYNTSLMLDNNLTLSANSILHIDGNTIIEGNNHTLFVDNNAQIFVDTNATLTLRNLILRNGRHSLTQPPVKLASHNSSLALDNVTLAPSNDFLFPQGQFFVHNDVKFTGTSAFIYKSPIPSWVTSGARLMFDEGTTLSVAPSTYTDAPYSLKNTYTDCNFIKMTDQTSILCFNGSTLETTHTGLRLTKGTVLFDNTVNHWSDSSLTITGFGPNQIIIESYEPLSMAWAPDGKHFIITGTESDGRGHTIVCSFNNGISSYFGKLDRLSTASTVAWSPDGQYVAIGGCDTTFSTSKVQVVHFDGSSFTALPNLTYGTKYETTNSVAWSPDGKYLAVGGTWNTSNKFIQVYRFDGNQFTTLTNYPVYENTANTVTWSPDGQYLAVGGTWSTSNKFVQVYRFDGNQFTALSNYPNYQNVANTIAWSPDGRFLAVGGTWSTSNKFVQVYRFDGETFVQTTAIANYNNEVVALAWSPDGCTLAVTGKGDNPNHVLLYGFDGEVFTTINDTLYTHYGNTLAWSPDNNYLLVGGQKPQKRVALYPCSFGNIKTLQALSKSIVFGDSEKGPDYDAKIKLSNAARLNVDGLINYDNVITQTLFTNRSTNIVLTTTNSKIRINTTSLPGWINGSIIKQQNNFGQGDYNLTNYAGDDQIITYNEAPTDLTESVRLYNTHQTLLDGETISGFVRFNDGFSILAGESATLDTCISVSGGFNLHNAGTLQLQGNLHLDGNSIINNGGTIVGKNTGLILDGNLTLSAGNILHIDGNTIIDGNNHTLLIDDNAQIFVDTNATLTLRNLILRNGQHTLTQPPIKLSTPSSFLALDNVTLTPINDFLFQQGQLFIHNDVQFTGSSAFIYKSPSPSWITSGAHWIFDIGTTFSVTPATHTDAPYVLSTPYTDCNFIKMADQSSTIYFNGSSLITTYTGLRLTKGTVLFDNAIETISDSKLSLNGFGSFIDTGNTIYSRSASWSPDGRYLAVGLETTLDMSRVRVYQFNGTAFNEIPAPIYGQGTDSLYAYAVSWSPDGRYLAIGGNWTSEYVKVYFFDGKSFTTLPNINYGGTAKSISWSPDGTYLAIGGEWTDNYVRVYHFNGTSFTSLTNPGYNGNVSSLAWSPDGKYLAVAGSDSSGYAVAYKINGNSFSAAINTGYGASANSIAWSPNNHYLVIGGTNTSEYIRTYRFDGTTFTAHTSIGYGYEVKHASWAPDGQYIAIAAWYDSTNIRIYRFSEDTLFEVATFIYGGSIMTTFWTPNEQFLTITGQQVSNTTGILPCSFGNITTPQAHSTSIIFGDSNKGSTYDANVILCSDAQVNVIGKLNYDCIN